MRFQMIFKVHLTHVPSVSDCISNCRFNEDEPSLKMNLLVLYVALKNDVRSSKTPSNFHFMMF